MAALPIGSAPADAPDISAPDISVSIVSYNTRGLLRECLLSLQARQAEGEASLEIIVVDNGSTDGTLEMLREFPAVTLLHGHGNIGYGRANNLAFEVARGRYFWILNSDTDVWPGAIRAMLAWMDSCPRAGACSVQLILPDGSIQDSCAHEPSLREVFYEQTRLNWLLPGRAKWGVRTMSLDDYRVRQSVEQIVGACMLVRRQAFAQVGGFDPAYFMYFEDTDLCLRLRRAGWELWFLPEGRIGHVMGGSSSDDWRTRARMIAFYNAGRYYYYSRYHGPRHAALLKALVLWGAAQRLLGWTLLAIVRPRLRFKVRLFRDVLRRTRRMNPRDPAQGFKS